MPKSKKMMTTILKLLKGGARTGLGFGLAVSTVHLAVGIALILRLGMPPMTWFVAKSLVLEVPLAVAVGLLCSPLHLLGKGRFVQPVVMAAIWIVLERYVAIDPSKPQMWLVPSLVALALFYLFQWIAQKRIWIVPAVTVVALVVLIVTPIVRYRFSDGYKIPATASVAAPPNGAPDVVFLVMDTVRAQSVSAYGYERKTTPVFDEFAKKGVLFEKATAPSTWSLPAHGSLFTGMLPSMHNAHSETRWLDDKYPTLAESMARAGWETRCFTANPHINPSFGLTRGFGWQDNAWLTGAGGRGFAFIYRFVDALGVSAEDKGGGLVVSNVENWMKQRPADARPAFVFVNFLEAHFPFHQLPEEYRYMYTKKPLSELRAYGQIAFGAQMGRQLTPEEHRKIHQPILDLYDGGINYTDYLLGKVIDAWRKRGTLDRTVFVVLGDHGEHVAEHGAYGHFSSLYEQDLWVPFMIYYPPKIPPGKRVAQEVSTMGTFATIFDLIDVEPPDTLMIGSLLPALRTGPDGKPAAPFGRPVMAERFEEKLMSSRFRPGTANGEGPLLSPWGRYRTYRSGKHKLVKHFEKGKFHTHLFDLEADPGEMNDLTGQALATAYLDQMEKELRNWETVKKIPPLDGEPGEVKKSADSKVSDEAMEQLRALGYVE